MDLDQVELDTVLLLINNGSGRNIKKTVDLVVTILAENAFSIDFIQKQNKIRTVVQTAHLLSLVKPTISVEASSEPPQFAQLSAPPHVQIDP